MMFEYLMLFYYFSSFYYYLFRVAVTFLAHLAVLLFPIYLPLSHTLPFTAQSAFAAIFHPCVVSFFYVFMLFFEHSLSCYFVLQFVLCLLVSFSKKIIKNKSQKKVKIVNTT